MGRSRIVLFLIVFVAVLTVIAVVTWRRRGRRPASVPATAVLVDGRYIDCVQTDSRFGEPCKVYDRTSGKLLDADPFSIRLEAFSKKQGGGSLTDCGKTSMRAPDARVAECVKSAFKNYSPFTAEYLTDYGVFNYAYGIAGDAAGKVAEATYDSRGFPNVAPNRRTQLLDGNRVRFTPCVEPISIETDNDGVAGCVTPVNEAASAALGSLKPIDTTICAIAENPSAFNNKLVRVRGHYSGNFEYSMLSGEGCSESIWFDYASDDSPPGLAVHVPGGAMPGGEDDRGWRIRPLRVSLVKDQNFRKFQRLMEARVEAEKRGERVHPGGFISYRVTATFIGRIDGVSPEIHQFHRKRAERDRADFLGFGQMGLFDAQLIMQSVEGDAVLKRER